jgi:hypothetical protein
MLRRNVTDQTRKVKSIDPRSVDFARISTEFRPNFGGFTSRNMVEMILFIS